MNNHETKKEIFVFLKEKGCCLRCCLRFSDNSFIDPPKAYREPIITSKNLKYIDDDFQADEKVPCVTCLGILQENMINIAVQQVAEKIKGSYSDVHLFSCNLTIPPFIFLRERSMQICVADHFSIVENNLLQYKDSLKNLKDIWRWCAYPKLEQALNVKSGYAACSGSSECSGCIKCIPSLIIDIFFAHFENDSDCKTLINECQDILKTNKRKRSDDDSFSRKSIETLLSEVGDNRFISSYSVPPKKLDVFVEIDNISCLHDSIFIGGRYTKLSRKLCQTPWHIKGEKKMETSLQEIIFDSIVKFINVESMKFLSAGREDVDVRMLHNGRPFAVELINLKSAKIPTETLSKIVCDINKNENVKIVSELQVLTKLHLKKLKEGESEKTKNYQALCMYKSKPERPDLLERLNEIENLDIVQKTPIRVLHRRPLISRNRKIYAIQARRLSDFGANIPKDYLKLSKDIEDLFVVDVKTQAGTYVKEFVHGDFGRTNPNLCDLLGAEVDIVALDVTGINLVWP